jgi:hypothetical protein
MVGIPKKPEVDENAETDDVVVVQVVPHDEVGIKELLWARFGSERRRDEVAGNRSSGRMLANARKEWGQMRDAYHHQ